MRIDKELLITILLSILVTLMSIALNTSSTALYSPYNTYDDGYSELLSITGNVFVVRNFKDFENGSVVLLPIIRELDSSRYEWLKKVLESGATVVLLDEVGYVNGFMDFIDLGARIEKVKVFDEVYKLKSRDYPLVLLDTSINGNAYRFRVAMYRPSYIVADETPNTFSRGVTSRYAYADTNGDSYYSIGEEMRVYTTICSFKVGNGELWLISDLDVFSNRVIGIDDVDNRRFLEMLVGSRKMYVVLDFLELSTVDIIKYSYNAVLSLHLPREHNAIGISIYLLLLSVLVVIRYAEKRS